MAAGDTGAASRPSRASLGSSRAKLRFSASIPAKVMATQSRPPDMRRVSSPVGSKEKLKITSTIRANSRLVFSTSLVRRSARASLPSTASDAFQNDVTANLEFTAETQSTRRLMMFAEVQYRDRARIYNRPACAPPPSGVAPGKVVSEPSRPAG